MLKKTETKLALVTILAMVFLIHQIIQNIKPPLLAQELLKQSEQEALIRYIEFIGQEELQSDYERRRKTYSLVGQTMENFFNKYKERAAKYQRSRLLGGRGLNAEEAGREAFKDLLNEAQALNYQVAKLLKYDLPFQGLTAKEINEVFEKVPKNKLPRGDLIEEIKKSLEENKIVLMGEVHDDFSAEFLDDLLKNLKKTNYVFALEAHPKLDIRLGFGVPDDQTAKRGKALEKYGVLCNQIDLGGHLYNATELYYLRQLPPISSIAAPILLSIERDSGMAVSIARLRRENPNKGILALTGAAHLVDSYIRAHDVFITDSSVKIPDDSLRFLSVGILQILLKEYKIPRDEIMTLLNNPEAGKRVKINYSHIDAIISE